ncbi:hypothetical protein GS966_13445 [Rhodococcus hoagii]|nr:hypothetical protein [Prescottella equi]
MPISTRLAAQHGTTRIEVMPIAVDRLPLELAEPQCEHSTRTNMFVTNMFV